MTPLFTLTYESCKIRVEFHSFFYILENKNNGFICRLVQLLVSAFLLNKQKKRCERWICNLLLPYNYITEEQVQAQYLNVENPIDGKVNVEINLDTFLLKIYDNGKVTFKLKTKDFRIVSYAIIRDVLFRKYLSEHNEGEINYQGISELVNKDIQRMYSKSCIEVYNETLKYIDDMNNNNCIG